MTIAGLTSEPNGYKFLHDNKVCTGLGVEYNNGTLYVTGMDQFTRGTTFESDFQFCLR